LKGETMANKICPAVILEGAGTLTYTFSQSSDKFIIMASNDEIEERIELNIFEAQDLLDKLVALCKSCKIFVDGR